MNNEKNYETAFLVIDYLSERIRKQQDLIDRISIWAHNNGEPSLQEMIDELEAKDE